MLDPLKLLRWRNSVRQKKSITSDEANKNKVEVIGFDGKQCETIVVYESFHLRKDSQPKKLVNRKMERAEYVVMTN